MSRRASATPPTPRRLARDSAEVKRGLYLLLAAAGAISSAVPWLTGRVSANAWAHPATLVLCLVLMLALLSRRVPMVLIERLVLGVALASSLTQWWRTGAAGALDGGRLWLAVLSLSMVAFITLAPPVATALAVGLYALAWTLPLLSAHLAGVSFNPDVTLGVQTGSALLLLGCLLLFNRNLAREQERARSMHELAHTDALTGLSNRRALYDQLETAVTEAQSGGPNVAVVLIDIDHFKRVNDTHGHPAGDEVLRGVAQALRACVRETDGAGRWGGEEFLVLLRDVEAMTLPLIAERLRMAVQNAHVGAVAPVTASLGVAVIGADDTLAAMLQRADDRLYRAKREGRDRVVFTDPAVAAD